MFVKLSKSIYNKLKAVHMFFPQKDVWTGCGKAKNLKVKNLN